MMHRVPRWAGRCPLAITSALLLLLAACGAETSTSGLRGSASVAVGTTIPNETPVVNPTAGPPPYAFPKSWQTAAGAPTNVDAGFAIAFVPSAPLTGYACDAPAANAANQSPALYVTHDGGQSWASASGGPLTQLQGGCSVSVDPTDARDVFLVGGTFQFGATVPSIWRSQDGGATWHQLADPAKGVTVQKITALGTRIVAEVAPNGEGQLANDLYSSDDGGATWHQFAASLPANVTAFVTLGESIVVETDPPSPGAADIPMPGTIARAAGSRARSASARLSSVSSGGPPPVFFRSDDSGNTWTKVNFPGGLPVFTQANGSSAYYGVSVAPPSQGNPPIAYWSQDSGATWKALPTLQGVEGNWIDPTSLGYGLAVAPDGSIFTDTIHALGSYQGESDAGIFMLRPGDSAPAWQPLAPGPSLSMTAVPTSGGVRLINLQVTSSTSYTCTPVYLDLL